MSADRKQPDSETDFSDLNDLLEEEPAPVKRAAPPPLPPAAMPRVRVPSQYPVRADIRRSVTPFGSPARRSTPPPPAASTVTTDPAEPDPALLGMAAPTRRPPPDRWLDDVSDAMGDLFGPGPDRSSGLPPVLGGPPRTPTSPGLAAPRLPALGPEHDVALGLEPELSTASVQSSPPHRIEDDLSWNRHDEDFGLSIGEVHPDDDPLDRIPTTLPKAAEGDTGDAYSLVHKASLSPPAVVPADPRREMNDRFALGDFSGALVIAEALMSEGHGDAAIQRVVTECRVRLEQMYASRLGAMTGMPSVAVPQSELRWLSLDHRAGFVLSLVDGRSSIEELIDIAGMPALEVLRVLYELLSQRVIEFKPGRTKK